MAIALNVFQEQKDLKNKKRYNEGYRLVGNHSAVKICAYCKKAIKGQDVCYKNTFYGIESWRCVQMSPTFFCDHRCVFCWREPNREYEKLKEQLGELTPDGVIGKPFQIEGFINLIEQIKSYISSGYEGDPPQYQPLTPQS